MYEPSYHTKKRDNLRRFNQRRRFVCLDNRKISSYSFGVRRKPGTLIPIEQDILEAGLALSRRGEPSFHGFLIAKEIQEDAEAKRLTSHGTLYKALDRLERAGHLASQWEDPEEAAIQQRPRRRLYQVSVTGAQALAKSHVAARAAASGRRALEGA